MVGGGGAGVPGGAADLPRNRPKPPCSGNEPSVADRVEAVMPADGIEPGSRERHDAQPDRLRVDFVYPKARPRSIAMEVTALVAGGDYAGARAADWLTGQLTKIAENEGLGAWL